MYIYNRRSLLGNFIKSFLSNPFWKKTQVATSADGHSLAHYIYNGHWNFYNFTTIGRCHFGNMFRKPVPAIPVPSDRHNTAVIFKSRPGNHIQSPARCRRDGKSGCSMSQNFLSRNILYSLLASIYIIKGIILGHLEKLKTIISVLAEFMAFISYLFDKSRKFFSYLS